MTAEKDNPIHVPVLIAGGGPVGLVLALELGRRGVGCMVLNDQPMTAQHPKANAISARSMEHFRRLGLAEKIRASGLDDDHPTDVAYFTRLTGRELGRLHMPSRAEALRQARDGDGPWAGPEPPHRCSQIFLEQCLKSRAEEFPEIDLRFGWRLESFADSDGGVTAEAVEVASGRRLTVTADYLAGCDGGAGLVRKQLAIEYEGESGVIRPFMGGSMFAAYFRATPDPSWLSVGRSWQYWVINPECRALLIHVDSKDLFLIHTVLPEGVEPGDDAARMVAHQAAGTEFPMQVISSVSWTAGYSLVAQRYREGRIFIAGDAAHLFTPTGGLGMNTGVDDAVNLGWKLAAVCRGWGGPALLDSYEAERRPIGLRNVNFARGFATSVGTVPVTEDVERDSEAGRSERAALRTRLEDHAFREFIIPGIQFGQYYKDSPVISFDGAVAPTAPPPDQPNSYAPSITPGARAPHLWLPGGDALFDRFGTGLTLVRTGGGGTEISRIVEAAARRRMPMETVDLPDAETGGLYTGLVLVRPDGHIAWRGDSPPADCEAFMDKISGA